MQAATPPISQNNFHESVPKPLRPYAKRLGRQLPSQSSALSLVCYSVSLNFEAGAGSGRLP
jgi:hypothetical protein